ncbi:hypothetical protein EB093_04780 [bacterium]|nr:hypothetical protein [bacterium]
MSWIVRYMCPLPQFRKVMPVDPTKNTGEASSASRCNGIYDGTNGRFDPNTVGPKQPISPVIVHQPIQTIPYKTNGSYTGTILNGVPNGIGKYTSLEGVYEGQFCDGKFCGEGKLTDKDGDIYQGSFENDVPHGQGKRMFTDGNYQEGKFNQGRFISGSVKQRDATGACYEGQFDNGAPQGTGKMKYLDGDVYEGPFDNGEPHGSGKMTYSNGSVYEGQFDTGKYHGSGTLKHTSGDTYEGNWRYGQQVGEVIYSNLDKVALKFTRRYQDGKVVDVSNEELIAATITGSVNGGESVVGRVMVAKMLERAKGQLKTVNGTAPTLIAAIEDVQRELELGVDARDLDHTQIGNILDRLQDGESIVVSAGYIGHDIAVYITSQDIFICNLGQGVQRRENGVTGKGYQPVVQLSYDTLESVRDVLIQLNVARSSDSIMGLDIVYRQLSKIPGISFVNSVLTRMSKKNPQYLSNCFYKSHEILGRVALIFKLTNVNDRNGSPNSNKLIEIAKNSLGKPSRERLLEDYMGIKLRENATYNYSDDPLLNLIDDTVNSRIQDTLSKCFNQAKQANRWTRRLPPLR